MVHSLAPDPAYRLCDDYTPAEGNGCVQLSNWVSYYYVKPAPERLPAMCYHIPDW
jgi:hypothetical protein